MSDFPRGRLRKADFVQDEAEEAGDDEVAEEERHADQSTQFTDLELEEAKAFEERVKENMCHNWKQQYTETPHLCGRPLSEHDFKFDTYVKVYNLSTNEWTAYDGYICWHCRRSREDREATQMRKDLKMRDKQAAKDVQSRIRLQEHEKKMMAAKAVSDRNRALGMASAQRLAAAGIPVPGLALRSPSPRGSPRIKAPPTPPPAPPVHQVRALPPPPSPTASISPPTERFAALRTESPPATPGAIHITADMCSRDTGLITLQPADSGPALPVFVANASSPPTSFKTDLVQSPSSGKMRRLIGAKKLVRRDQPVEVDEDDIDQLLDAALKEVQATDAPLDGDASTPASVGALEEGEIPGDLPDLVDPRGD